MISRLGVQSPLACAFDCNLAAAAAAVVVVVLLLDFRLVGVDSAASLPVMAACLAANLAEQT